MKENNYCNDANRPANKNTKIISVIVVVAITITLGIGLSLTPTAMIRAQMDKAIIMHFHPHLNLMIDGKPVTVPSQIGIDPSLWKDHSLDQYGMQAMANGMSGMAQLHTHDATGTIHVESSIIRNYTLGEFLHIWGGLDTSGKTVKATIDGKPVSDYRATILRDGEHINLQVGK
ncbi:MAG: hypothetical protein DLM72_01575 [Candidatus Nitrosopolaris wilkensis]|nr:MAG: hypothetical protein DLM72_01575 [Candidatus Nitrosopolaris wilkensis]